jgi:hypothetical protein
MKQDVDWVMISDLFDPIALFKLIKKLSLKQSDNQYRTAVVIAEQLLILQFRQDDQVMTATYYDHFTTRVEVARQTGVCCYYTPDLLDMKAVELGKALSFTKLLDIEQKAIIELVKQEYVAYFFINNSNKKMHTQLKKDVANDYSKGNQDAYPSDIHRVLTLMNEYKPLKLDNPVVSAQGISFATKGSYKGGKKGGSKSKKYYSDAKWKALSSEAQTKIINEERRPWMMQKMRSLLQVPNPPSQLNPLPRP